MMDKLLERFPFLNGTDWSQFPEDVQKYLRHLYMTYNGTLNGTRDVNDVNSPYWIHVHPIVMATLVSLATAAGIVGNIMMCYSIMRSKDIKAGSSTLLVNLCAASLLFLIVCAPILILHDLLYFDWIFGLFMCKFVPYTMHVTLYVITYTLAVISLYQYVAVTFPDKFMTFCTRGRTIAALLVVWALFLILNIPHLVGYELEGRNSSVQCYYKGIVQDKLKAKIWCALYFAFFLSIPLCVMVGVTGLTLYRERQRGRPREYHTITASSSVQTNKHRVTLITLITLLLFSVCWIPFQTMLMLGTFHSLQYWTPSHTIFLDIGMCLAYMNPSVNPYIYMTLHPEVRRAVAVHVFGREASSAGEQEGTAPRDSAPNGDCAVHAVTGEEEDDCSSV